MLLASHLARSRHGVFQFRVVLPDALALAIGQKEIRRSLGTREPEAARLAAYGLSAKIIPLVRSLSNAMASNPEDIVPENIREALNTIGSILSFVRLHCSTKPGAIHLQLSCMMRRVRSISCWRCFCDMSLSPTMTGMSDCSMR